MNLVANIDTTNTKIPTNAAVNAPYQGFVIKATLGPKMA